MFALYRSLHNRSRAYATVAAVVASAVLASALPAPAHATEVGYGRKFGLGFVLGEPTAFVGKYWVGRTNAVDMGFGFYGYSWDQCGAVRCGGYQSFSFHADYLWQSNLVRGTAQLDWHIGAGGRAIVWRDNDPNRSNVAIGPRMPIGLDLMFNNPNFLEIFFELAPILYVNGPDFDIEGGLGVRLYF